MTLYRFHCDLTQVCYLLSAFLLSTPRRLCLAKVCLFVCSQQDYSEFNSFFHQQWLIGVLIRLGLRYVRRSLGFLLKITIFPTNVTRKFLVSSTVRPMRLAANDQAPNFVYSTFTSLPPSGGCCSCPILSEVFGVLLPYY